MSFGQRLGRAFDSLARATAAVGKVGGKAAGTVAKSGIKTASKLGNKAMDGVEAVAKADKKKVIGRIKDGVKHTGKVVVDDVLTNDESYKHIGKVGVSFRGNLIDEIGTHTRGVGNFLYNVGAGFDVPFTKGKIKTPALLKASEDSLIGIKATGFGTTLAIGGAAIAGVPRAAKTYAEDRQGQSDGQSVGNAPAPYVPAYQQNAGATGDLVFALNDMRRG